ncbi:hypothetical protein GE061_010621 [Apolygus lucorum]|uniref:Enoyl-CoA hydratase n=1 Tax=Apolygus lucorum TaxID=248454 RepID=A0A8S9XX82_APOLU|nr:hypothetical protein GE061_010621 [Apolygus lucorum]
MIVNKSIRCHRLGILSFPLPSKYFNKNTFQSRSLVTEVTVKYQGPVACIGINRPHMKNCLTPVIAAKLKEAIELLENNDRASVGVLYGERGTFSYGIHPEDLQNNSNIYEEILNTGLLDKYPRKPIVAAVSGYAIGLAFDLALWCDFRITEDTAVLASYARNSGIPTNCRLTKRLVSCVGSHRALDWLLSGRPVKPKEGLEAGAVTRIVACGSGLGQAVNFAHSLANMPQCSLRADRALIYSETGKFENNEEILAEWKLNHSKALLEVEEGVHITKSGDVRHKEWK